jgi:hypothetical protein
LGVWINNKLKESYIKAKAMEIVRQTVVGLKYKKVTLSQLAYINNACIIPKLCYMLQVTKLPKRTIDAIHQPFIRLVKNKAEIISTVENCIIKHRGLGGCNSLWHELVTKQITNLVQRLNSYEVVGKVTRIRLKQGFALAGFTKDSDITGSNNVQKGFWKGNLTCLTLERAKS